MNNLISIVSSCLLVAASSTCIASEKKYQEGLSAYQAGDCKTARELFTQLSDEGIGNATNQLGLMYAEDVCGKPNNQKALDLYLKAAAQGSNIAKYNIATFYMKGIILPKDNEKALPA